MATRSRIHLGTRTGLSFVHKVYRTADAIEVDEVEGVDVTRRRVLLDEVLLVTYHRSYGLAFVLSFAVLVTVFTALSLLIGLTNQALGLLCFALTALPSLALLSLRLVLGVDVLTVHGRRTRAEVHFWLRKRRGREIFRQVCRDVRERQAQLARPLARPAAPSPPFPRPPDPATGPPG